MRGPKAVRIGAILTFAGEQQENDFFPKPPQSQHAEKGVNASNFLLDILGESLLHRTISKLRNLGTLPPVVVCAKAELSESSMAKSTLVVTRWESAVAHYVRQGAEMLFLLRISAYSDLDVAELLRFHLDTQSGFTQVYALDRSLDVALVNMRLLQDARNFRRELGKLISQQHRFTYAGYVNYLRDSREFYQLMQDGLNGHCSLTPRGTEISPGVWCGTDASVAKTAGINAPVFIGAGSVIGAGCTIEGAASIERNCEIDSATAISESWILQNTFVGAALNVRRSVVNGPRLFHLERDLELSIADQRLVGPNARRRGVFASFRFPFRGESLSQVLTGR